MSWSRRYEDHTSSELIPAGGAGGGDDPAGGGPAGKIPPSVGGSSAAGRRMRAPSQVAEIEEEMRLLQWHKTANEAALKAAIIRTRKLKQRNREQVIRERNREKALWMQQVIEEENAKTLEVTDDFIRRFEEEERRAEERLEREVDCHIQCLRKLQRELVAREELRKRNTIYRQRKRAWMAKYEGRTMPAAAARSEPSFRAQQATEVTRGATQAVQQTLSKLMDLERRITDLEVAGAAKSVDFAARQQPAQGTRPAARVYAVTAQRASKTAPPRRRARDKRNDAAVDRWLRDRQQQARQRRAHLRARSERQQAVTRQQRAPGAGPRRRDPQQWHEMRRQMDRERRDAIASARRVASGAPGAADSARSARARRPAGATDPIRQRHQARQQAQARARKRAWGANVQQPLNRRVGRAAAGPPRSPVGPRRGR